MKNKIIITLLIMIFTANAGFCEVSRRAVVNDIAVKFIIAMGGVIVSSLVIFGGLSIYNKFFVNKVHKYEEEILKTPRTVEDSIQFFISKNRLD